MSDSGGRVRVLGTVEIDGVTVGSQFGRTLLALLAVAPGHATSTSALIDGLWGEVLPQHPSTALQVQVTRLRKRFADATTPLVSTRGGYVLILDPDDVDLVRFHAEVDR
ncbi:MAG: helix-turn-helix domain-containing protein, partial [Williamsia herbipolensis]|nr:helix-turn-helix domain-containing protein [Williamsia herbipolensis]